MAQNPSLENLSKEVEDIKEKISSLGSFTVRDKKELAEIISSVVKKSLREEEKVRILNSILTTVWVFGALSVIVSLLSIAIIFWLAK